MLPIIESEVPGKRTLPNGVIGVLEIKIGQEVALVKRVELIDQNVEGPGIGGDVMKRKSEKPLVVFRANEESANGEIAAEIERVANFIKQAEVKREIVKVEVTKVEELNGEIEFGADDLSQETVAHEVAGA